MSKTTAPIDSDGKRLLPVQWHQDVGRGTVAGVVIQGVRMTSTAPAPAQPDYSDVDPRTRVVEGLGLRLPPPPADLMPSAPPDVSRSPQTDEVDESR